MPSCQLKAQPQKGCGLAINLFDLDRIDPFMREMFGLSKVLLPVPIVVYKNSPDETCVEFYCDLLQAACICDIIRDHDRKAGDYPCRVYIRREVWSKVTVGAMLTIVKDGRGRLNPEFFNVKVEPVKALPPPTRKVVQ